MISLSARVSLSAAAVLTFFVAVTALALDRAFEQNARSAMRERLFAQIYLVMAATELDAAGKPTLPRRLAEPRLNLPGSGLYARIAAPDGRLLWHSPSAIGIELPSSPRPEPAPFSRVALNGADHFLARLEVDWETDSGVVPLVFSVLEDLGAYNRQMNDFRRSLWGWLGAMALLLLLALAGTLAWGLRPLRTVAREVRSVESGSQGELQREYPKEISALTKNINRLLQHERAQQSRYKNALADLAHSLKTPLAVLRGLEPSERSPLIDEQVSRMDNIVHYQLQRAATAGRSALAAPVPVAPLAERIVASLHKVYRDKPIRLEQTLDPECRLRSSEGDLMEVLGNLLDNAWKWARSEIRLQLECRHESLVLVVEDDGPGIGADRVQQVLARGVRLDEATPGHGIGLPMVRDIVEAYEGRLTIGRSDLGGARIKITLPH
jgi:two-component system sensor histidine kinase PhoQ